MIKLLANISTQNTGGVKTASVFAMNDETAGTQTITFTIIDQTQVQTEDFGADESKVVTVNHTASGLGFVQAVSGPARDLRFCNVDAPDGSGVAPEALLDLRPSQLPKSPVPGVRGRMAEVRPNKRKR
ncbi:MAG: hypothetical protein EHM18_00850 [Acidobacteria bacterium]|nr:MAG: hypothetical protein EHM18_00850 [Acidobacteriota bacterium]